MTSLELFLLGLINTGINTPYLFRERAGISVGATLPALARLQKDGSVRANERGPRNRQEFSLTPKGKRSLKTELDKLLADYLRQTPTDIESVLRVAALGLAAQKDREVSALLTAAAKACKNRVSRASVEDYFVEDTAATYKYFLARTERWRLDAQAGVLSEIADDVASLSATDEKSPTVTARAGSKTR